MRERAQKILELKSLGQDWIGTIHSMANKILKKDDNFELVGLKKGF
jgi:superfamily I DNA/RNA helicase